MHTITVINVYKINLFCTAHINKTVQTQ